MWSEAGSRIVDVSPTPTLKQQQMFDACCSQTGFIADPLSRERNEPPRQLGPSDVLRHRQSSNLIIPFPSAVEGAGQGYSDVRRIEFVCQSDHIGERFWFFQVSSCLLACRYRGKPRELDQKATRELRRVAFDGTVRPTKSDSVAFQPISDACDDP
jgi:hypothetical protein